jgi:putative selenium metabolism protein SsnA
MIIYDANILTFDDDLRIIPDGAIYVKDDTIADIGKSAQIRQQYADLSTIDAEGKVLMPGLINTHTHLYGTFARGMPLKGRPPQNFLQILDKVWWNLDRALNDEAIYYSALFPLSQAVRCGTTTIFDHHSSPNAIEGRLGTIGDIIEAIGLRACLCYEVSDRDGSQRAEAAIRENVDFAEECKTENALIRGMIGLHASFTLSNKTIAACVEAARDLNVGLHIHCAEDAADLAHARKRFKASVVSRLNTLGVLGKQTIAAHCVHVDSHDIELLAESKTFVAHNPRSNMNNAVGCAPVIEMTKSGVRVGLGTDGMSSSMWDELKTGFLLHKHQRRDPRIGGPEMFDALFRRNAELASHVFNSRIGVIAKGAKADIIIVDYHAPTPMTPDNLIAHVVFGIADSPVDTTIVNGKILMRSKESRRIDEAAVAARAREVANTIWKRL